MGRPWPRWLLPTLLVLPFAAVLTVDVGRWALARWWPPQPLLEIARVGFEPRDVVVDLETLSGPASVGVELGKGWLAPRAGGRWTLDDRSRLWLELESAGFRRLLVECGGRPEGVGARELTVKVNGIECGRRPLEPGRQRLAFDLPEGSLQSGRNLVELEHPLPAGRHRGAARLALRWHRLGLAGGAGATFDQLDGEPAFEVDSGSDRVLVRRSGRLTLAFATEGFKSVVWRYAFLGLPEGAGGPVVEVTLERSGREADPERRTLDSARRQAAAAELGPVRFSGPARLVLDVSLPDDGIGFELESPRIGRIY